MNKKIIGSFLSGFICSWAGNGFATLPVIDISSVTNLIKNYAQLKKQYDMLTKTYRNAKSQLSEAKHLTSDTEGNYGYGNLFNRSDDLAKRKWSPDNWESTLKGLSGGNASRYQELVASYKRNHSSLSESDYKKGSSDDQASQYVKDIQVNQAATVNATYAFNNIKTHIETIHSLSEKIEQTPNTKAATDLNSRLMTEVAFIQAQELKMQILLNQQMAQQHSDSIATQTAMVKFNTIPD